MKNCRPLLTLYTFLWFFFCSNAFAQYASCPTSETDPSDGAYLIDRCCELTQNNATYRLKNDITEKRGTECFKISGRDNVTFDLAGKTVTYDTGPVADVANGSFENGTGISASNWDFSNAPDAQRVENNVFYRFGGHYTLVFPSNSQAQYIESDPIHIEAGIKYRLMVLTKRSVPTLYMDIPQLTGECDSPETGSAGTGTSWYNYGCIFDVPVDMDVTVRLGINGEVTEDAVIDMVEISPEFTELGSVFRSENGASNIKVMNGSFVQGAAKTFGVYAGSQIFTITGTVNPEISDITVISSGTMRTPVYVNGTTGANIHHNTFIANGTYGRRRDQLLAGIHVNESNSNYNRVWENDIYTYQTGIKFGGTGNEIFNNRIHQNTYMTNGYGIAIRPMAVNTKVYNNTITGAGRGIHITRGTNTEVYGNHLDLTEYPNPEYPSWDTYTAGTCVHGLKFEIETTHPTSVHAHHNYVRGYQDEPGKFGGCPFQISIDEANLSCDILIDNNEFVTSTYQSTLGRGAPVAGYLSGVDHPDGLVIKNNTFISNSRGLFYVLNVFGVVFDSNTFINENFSVPESDFHFVHNTYGGTLRRFGDTLFLNTTAVRMDLTNPMNVGITSAWNYFVGWYLDISVKNQSGNPIEGARVQVPKYVGTDFSQYTGPDGFFRIPLEEYELLGTGDIFSQSFYSGDHTDYTATVSSNGGTQSQSVTLDDNKSINFTFSGTSTDTTPPAAVTDLSISDCSDSACTLSFTAPGDDGMSGLAESYDIRYSTSEINASNFNSASQALGSNSIIPLAPYSVQFFAVVNLLPDTVYYFAMKTTDDSGNTSTVSNIVSQRTEATGGIDTTAPVRYSPEPSGILDEGTAQATISLNTSETARCRYSDVSGTPYDGMAYDFGGEWGIIHSVEITGLRSGETYVFYVRCIDLADNVNTDDFLIEFSVEGVKEDISDPDIYPQSYDSNGSLLVSGGCSISQSGSKKGIPALFFMVFILLGLLGFGIKY